MTASGSEPKPSESTEAATTDFMEEDRTKTSIPYDKGGVPLYIALAWAAFIVTYIAFMAMVALPDLRAWIGK